MHRESLLPTSGETLLDALDDNSHKHAFAVSEDLKHALRECIELIGNEAIRHKREVAKERLYDRPDANLAEQLSIEASRCPFCDLTARLRWLELDDLESRMIGVHGTASTYKALVG